MAGQAASSETALGLPILRMIGAPILATPVPTVLQRCLGISRLPRRMFVIVSLGGGQSFEPRMSERLRPSTYMTESART